MFPVVYQTWRNAGAGLMLAYSSQFIMFYWVGAFMHVLPWANLSQNDFVVLGFQQSTYAVIAFAVGSLVLGPSLAKRIERRQRGAVYSPDPRLPRAYITYGIASYFIFAPTLGRLAGFNAIASVGSQLVVVGCCLNSWHAWKAGGKRALFRSLAPTLLIPAITVVVQGFLGYGVIALSTIAV